ncbi:tetratricopeptide repeat protein [Maribacter hydrothermalis]|uniref:Tetratricopeptide repeat-containing protein n=1 Tax=Maribacter hydrothermalis TaxID=1836467 RepID=A0A1B7ZEU3_9FLAO|nr:tetratricopeptide repeat protein [Maribacter hydrothermalis]APQ17579.1 hypothetical protein BTR34_09665 [Maribacter hydrothermalis]OBR42054.1 hypothetical protein A9200_01295 [Maribacter hydrothermalis]
MTKQEDLIEKYILNKLSSEEVLLVEDLLKNDAEFIAEYNFQSNLKTAIKKEDDDNFRNLISELESKARSKDSLPRRSYVKWMAAASIILLLGLSYFLTLNQKTSTDDLFVSYFEPYRNVVQPMQRGNEQQDEKSLAFLAYEKGEYDKAITLFSNLYSDTKEPYYLFYKANALLKLEKAKEAVPLLLEHLKTTDTLTEKTKWYLALAYLRLNDVPNAKLTLEKVISDGNYKTMEAQKLLKEFK